MYIIIKIKEPFALVGGMTGHMSMVQAQAGHQFATNRVPTACSFNDHPFHDHPSHDDPMNYHPVNGHPIKDNPNNGYCYNAGPVSAHPGNAPHVDPYNVNGDPNNAYPGRRASSGHYLSGFRQCGIPAPSDHYPGGFRQDGPYSQHLAPVNFPAPRLPQAGPGVASYGDQPAGLTVHRSDHPFPNMSGPIHQRNPTPGGESSASAH
ncbi:hypothetical protein GE09DRAFT_1217395 [Coniochaeta sp. 2T2.1]|nr:hypothetical protein GE09DRAFT_1217395 [Coniochaeta sp. 2T2.1]